MGAPLRDQTGRVYVEETNAGRTDAHASFRVYDRLGGPPRSPEQRVFVQVRVGVGVRYLSPQGPRDVSDEVTVCGWGEPAARLSWVQTVSFRPNRVVPFDSAQRQRGWLSTDRYREEAADVQGLDHFVEPDGTLSFVDSRSRDPRYAAAGVWARPLGHPEGEVIYDSAHTELQLLRVMREQPGLQAILGRLEFRDYLFRYPRDAWGLNPLLVVVRYEDCVFERASPGANPALAPIRRAWTGLIHPNPVLHPGLAAFLPHDRRP